MTESTHDVDARTTKADYLKVVSIIGGTRSGSTIIDNILGEYDGFFSTGELHYLWERGLIQGRKCGCGRKLRECEVWSQVIDRVFEDPQLSRMGAAGVVLLQRRTVRTRHTAKLLRSANVGQEKSVYARDYARIANRLYTSIAEVTGSRVIVDSSKRPSDAALVRRLPGITSYVVHLVRDPRAVAFSWLSKKEEFDSEAATYMPQHGSLYTSIRWLGINAMANIVRFREPLGQAFLVRYEDFVAQPRTVIEGIVSAVGESTERTPFMDERAVFLAANHTVSGNPSRFRTGVVQLCEDRDWRHGLGGGSRLVTTAVSMPLLRHYGYSFRSRTESRSQRAIP
jgi:hypothetical protein